MKYFIKLIDNELKHNVLNLNEKSQCEYNIYSIIEMIIDVI